MSLTATQQENFSTKYFKATGRIVDAFNRIFYLGLQRPIKSSMFNHQDSKEEATEFQMEIVGRINQWWEKHQPHEIFVPPNFMSWEQCSAADYYLHICTIYGIGSREKVDLASYLRFYEAWVKLRKTKDATIFKRALSIFNADIDKGEQIENIEPSTYHFVPISRVIELQKGNDNPGQAFCHIGLPTKDVVLPIWGVFSKESAQLETAVHELGHFYRSIRGIDMFNEHFGRSQFFEEGVVQAHAKGLCQPDGSSRQSSEKYFAPYYGATWMVEQLQKKVGVKSFFYLSAAEIRDLLNSAYPEGFGNFDAFDKLNLDIESVEERIQYLQNLANINPLDYLLLRFRIRKIQRNFAKAYGFEDNKN